MRERKLPHGAGHLLGLLLGTGAWAWIFIAIALAGCAYGPQAVIYQSPPRHLPPVAWAPDCSADPTCVVLVNNGWRPLWVAIGRLPEFRMEGFSATANRNFDFGRYDLRVEVEVATALGTKLVPIRTSPVEITPTRRPRPIVLPTIE